MINLTTCPTASPMQGGNESPLHALNSDYTPNTHIQCIPICGPQSSALEVWSSASAPAYDPNGNAQGKGTVYGQFGLTYAMLPAAISWIQNNWAQFLSNWNFPGNGTGITDNPGGGQAGGVWDGSKVVALGTYPGAQGNGFYGLPFPITQPYSGYLTCPINFGATPNGYNPTTSPPYFYDSSIIPSIPVNLFVCCVFFGSNRAYFVNNYLSKMRARCQRIITNPNPPPNFIAQQFLQDIEISMLNFVNYSGTNGDANANNTILQKNVVPVTSGNLINGWYVVPMADYFDVSSLFVLGAGTQNQAQGQTGPPGPQPVSQYTGIDSQSFGSINIPTII